MHGIKLEKGDNKLEIRLNRDGKYASEEFNVHKRRKKFLD